LITTGVNRDGTEKYFGVEIGNSESEQSWSEFFKHLKQRGLKGVDFVVSDHHGGLINAVATDFQGATWQRCQTHFSHNILTACPKHLKEPSLRYLT
jgi:transposase-like protein